MPDAGGELGPSIGAAAAQAREPSYAGGELDPSMDAFPDDVESNLPGTVIGRSSAASTGLSGVSESALPGEGAQKLAGVSLISASESALPGEGAQKPAGVSLLSYCMQNSATELCAIRASSALQRFGEAFRNEDCDPSQHRREVASIDAFWSYSRHARQRDIVLTLLLQYNGLPAAAAGFGASVVAAFLVQRASVGSHRVAGVITMLCGACALLPALLLWRSGRSVFLDRACISQDDEEKKRNGILSLGYFLKKSRNMLVLWDGTYLCRLWCVFEFAAFLKLKSNDDSQPASLKFLPSIHGALTFYVMLAILARATLQGLVLTPDSEPESMEEVVKSVAVSQIAGLFVLGLLAKAIGRLVVLFASQQEQLREFSLHAADCYCCSVGHVHPQTKRQLNCDRALITQSVIEWFGDVEAFDQFARLEVRRHVDTRAYLPLHYVLFASQPMLWELLGSIAWQLRDGQVGATFWRHVARQVVMGVFGLPTIWSLAWLAFSCFFTTHSSRRMSDNRAAACSVALALLFFAIAGLLFNGLAALFGLYGYFACALILGAYLSIAYRRQL